jgi:hypothetical protein
LKQELEQEKKKCKGQLQLIENLREEVRSLEKKLKLAEERAEDLKKSKEQKVRELEEELEQAKGAESSKIVERYVIPPVLKDLLEQQKDLSELINEAVQGFKEMGFDDEDKGKPWLETEDGRKCQAKMTEIVCNEYKNFPGDDYDCEHVTDTFFGPQETEDREVLPPQTNASGAECKAMRDAKGYSVCIRGMVSTIVALFRNDFRSLIYEGKVLRKVASVNQNVRAGQYRP